MKKIVSLFICTILLLLCTTKAAAAEYEKITDESTIEQDLTMMGLNYSDYAMSSENIERLKKFSDSEGYSEQFVVAVGENYDHPSNQIASYIYYYNPIYYYRDINITLDIYANDVQSVIAHYNNDYKDMEILKEDKTAGILCFKFEGIFSKTDLVRKYNVNINDSGMGKEGFECQYVTEYSGEKMCNYFNYDSVLYITKDKVVSCVFKDCKDIQAGPLSDMFTAMFKSDPNLNTVAYFYNFSSDKKIEKIISANMSWIANNHRSGYLGINPNFIPIETKNDRTPKNEVIGIQDRTEIKLWDDKFTIDPFAVPASERLNQLPKDYVSQMTKEEKANFTDYEYSILFESGLYKNLVYNVTDIFTGEKPYYYKEMLLVEDVRLTKLVYETDGVIYSSIAVDNDGPDDGIGPNDKPDVTSKELETGWDKFVEWFKDNFPFSILIIVAPVIVIIVIAIFCPHIFTLILNYLVAAGRFVIKIIQWIIEIIINVITLPFRLIFRLFKRE